MNSLQKRTWALRERWKTQSVPSVTAGLMPNQLTDSLRGDWGCILRNRLTEDAAFPDRVRKQTDRCRPQLWKSNHVRFPRKPTESGRSTTHPVFDVGETLTGPTGFRKSKCLAKRLKWWRFADGRGAACMRWTLGLRNNGLTGQLAGPILQSNGTGMLVRRRASGNSSGPFAFLTGIFLARSRVFSQLHSDGTWVLQDRRPGSAAVGKLTPVPSPTPTCKTPTTKPKGAPRGPGFATIELRSTTGPRWPPRSRGSRRLPGWTSTSCVPWLRRKSATDPDGGVLCRLRAAPGKGSSRRGATRH